jgi:hypothetical protein
MIKKIKFPTIAICLILSVSILAGNVWGAVSAESKAQANINKTKPAAAKSAKTAKPNKTAKTVKKAKAKKTAKSSKPAEPAKVLKIVKSTQTVESAEIAQSTQTAKTVKASKKAKTAKTPEIAKSMQTQKTEVSKSSATIKQNKDISRIEDSAIPPKMRAALMDNLKKLQDNPQLNITINTKIVGEGGKTAPAAKRSIAQFVKKFYVDRGINPARIIIEDD